MDDDPWFRRFGGFGVAPINRKGWITFALMLLVAVPAGWLFVSLSYSHPTLSWVFAGIGAIAIFIGHALMFWHMKK